VYGGAKAGGGDAASLKSERSGMTPRWAR
jgi:hypothetical protein